MKHNIKAQSLSMSTVIIIILVLLVLVVIGYFFIKGSDDFGDNMGTCLTKGGTCEYGGCSGGKSQYDPSREELSKGITATTLCSKDGTSSGRVCCVYI
jgi:flagellar basal body-associated protein FliL